MRALIVAALLGVLAPSALAQTAPAVAPATLEQTIPGIEAYLTSIQRNAHIPGPCLAWRHGNSAPITRSSTTRPVRLLS